MVNREQLIDYLLHQMLDDERDAFNERWFSEPELCEELRAIEAELLDDYARGAATGERRRQIELCLLGSASQENKLQFAQALAQAFPAVPARRIPWARFAALAAMLILAAGVVMLILQNRQLNRKLAQTEAQPRRVEPVQPSTGPVIALFLQADPLRSAAGVSLNVPAGAEVVRLDLGLDANQSRGFDSALVSISGRIIWRQQPVTVNGSASSMRASLWIPAKLLAPGNYTVRLESNGAAEAYYAFTVQR